MHGKELVGCMHRLELIQKITGRRLLARLGLHTGQPPMLHFITTHPGCTQKSAADELDITPASAAASLKRLEKAGLVSRRTDKNDSRCNKLYVTEKGKQLNTEAMNQFELIDAKMLTGITEQEQAFFIRLCNKMFDNLAEESTRDLTICRLHHKANEAAQEIEEGE